VSPWDASPPVVQAIASARSYWSALDPDYEEEVHVLAAAAGAFTQPAVGQRAVLYSMSHWPRCCPKVGLAILEGDRLSRNIAFVGLAHDLWALPDFDGDGRDELVLAEMFMMGGQVSAGVTLVAFKDERLRELGGAGIFESSCGAGREGAMAARLSVAPGFPVMIEHYSRPSCESESWQPVGEPEPLVFTPAEETPYTDIIQE
jgi:hypothetical protein